MQHRVAFATAGLEVSRRGGRPVIGIANKMLAAIGLEALQTDMPAGQYSALAALAITFIWSMLGTNIIIFLTGMATLDQTLIEAARWTG